MCCDLYWAVTRRLFASLHAFNSHFKLCFKLSFKLCVSFYRATSSRTESDSSQFQYRLSTCGTLSLGVFTCGITQPPTPAKEPPDTPPSQYTPSPPLPSADLLIKTLTAAVSREITATLPPRKELLLGHIIATKTHNPCVKDRDMAVPSWWRARNKPSSGPTPPAPTNGDAAKDGGHAERGTTLCIHSLAVLPQYQNRGLGKLLMRSYLGRIEGSGVADRVALIARDDMVPFYEALGFVKQEAPSEVAFGGGAWHDMVWTVPQQEEPPIRRLDLRDEEEG